MGRSSTRLAFALASALVGCSVLRDTDRFDQEGSGGASSGAVGGSGASGSDAGGDAGISGTSATGGATGCGNNNQPCCTSGIECGNGLLCNQGTCVACGGPNQFCCVDQCNSSNYSCQAGFVCKPCGGQGQPCCGSSCNESTLFCTNGKCVICPYAGKANCNGFASHICDSSLKCVSCGMPGDACCNKNEVGGEWCLYTTDCCAPGADCNPCTTFPDCTCKKCCVVCTGQTTSTAVEAFNGDCPTAATKHCGSSNNVKSQAWVAGGCT
jgi:hypothetical protein